MNVYIKVVLSDSTTTIVNVPWSISANELTTRIKAAVKAQNIHRKVVNWDRVTKDGKDYIWKEPS